MSAAKTHRRMATRWLRWCAALAAAAALAACQNDNTTFKTGARYEVTFGVQSFVLPRGIAKPDHAGPGL